ncbi:MAG: O-succinylhomoserine sulfhydrylase [Venatoribacter sp.]
MDFSEFDERYQSDLTDCSFETLAVRAGQQRTMEHEHAEALFLTSSFVFNSAAEAQARFLGKTPGGVYSRYTNPTVRTFEQRLAALENAESCVATASGMAAIHAVCVAHLQAGDHIVCSASVFGSTVKLFEAYLRKFDVEISYVPLGDLNAWQQAMQSNTKLLYLESPSNPLNDVGDLRALSALAHQHNALLMVDNCFATPALQQPLKLGADIIIHSATKYIDGQGRVLGGAALGSKELIDPVIGVLRTAGPTMSAFNAWVFLKGLETLSIRMKVHCQNAMELATWLEAHPKVKCVNYCGLASHPHHTLAKSQQSAFGGMVSFEVQGGQAEAWHVIDSTKMISITSNLGDAKTTITHPATTTHSRMSEEERIQAGVNQALIRVSVGLENIDDIKHDLARGLDTLI